MRVRSSDLPKVLKTVSSRSRENKFWFKLRFRSGKRIRLSQRQRIVVSDERSINHRPPGKEGCLFSRIE